MIIKLIVMLKFQIALAKNIGIHMILNALLENTVQRGKLILMKRKYVFAKLNIASNTSTIFMVNALQNVHNPI